MSIVKNRLCPEGHACKVQEAKYQMSCDVCGCYVRRREGYGHSFVCNPPRIFCRRCIRELEGSGPHLDFVGAPPDGDACEEMCKLCGERSCNKPLHHTSSHVCGAPHACQAKARELSAEERCVVSWFKAHFEVGGTFSVPAFLFDVARGGPQVLYIALK